MHHARQMARQQPRRVIRLIDWLDVWGPRAGILALSLTIAIGVYVAYLSKAALASCGL